MREEERGTPAHGAPVLDDPKVALGEVRPIRLHPHDEAVRRRVPEGDVVVVRDANAIGPKGLADGNGKPSIPKPKKCLDGPDLRTQYEACRMAIRRTGFRAIQEITESLEPRKHEVHRLPVGLARRHSGPRAHSTPRSVKVRPSRSQSTVMSSRYSSLSPGIHR